MTYAEMREIAETGDVLLVRGNMLVRIFSAESYSHVALLVWLDDGSGGLWVFEFVEGKGFQAMPASQWFAGRSRQRIYYGTAPEVVRFNGSVAKNLALSYRVKRPVRRVYGYLSLLVVWASQVTGLRLPVWLRVCSTFVQECWEATGYTGLKRTADPGDIAEVCQSLTPITEEP